jgi:hypothetical protein
MTRRSPLDHGLKQSPFGRSADLAARLATGEPSDDIVIIGLTWIA